MASIRRRKTTFSTLVSTSRTKVNTPKMIRAGSTVATTGARVCVAAAKNPKATIALDTTVRYTAIRPTASLTVVLRADCSTKCSVTRADMNAWPGCGRSSMSAPGAEPAAGVVHGAAADDGEGGGQAGQVVDVGGQRVGRVGDDVGELAGGDAAEPVLVVIEPCGPHRVQLE